MDRQWESERKKETALSLLHTHSDINAFSCTGSLSLSPTHTPTPSSQQTQKPK